MNRRCATFVPFSACCVLLIPLHACGDEHPKLIGNWEAISAEISGQAIDDMNFAGMRYSFREDTFELAAGHFTPAGIAKKPPLRGSYTVDDSESPRHLTFMTEFANGKEQYEYIYDIEDDILTLCFTKAHEGRRGGLVRPKNFQSNGTFYVVYRFKRIARD